jgi:adenylylsulfate kinase-like enzyme
MQKAFQVRPMIFPNRAVVLIITDPSASGKTTIGFL